MSIAPPPSLAATPWLNRPETRAVLGAVARAGFEARVVGGAVRNTLIGQPVSDIDIATTATPEQTIKAVEAAGLKAIPTGLQHGTITVVANHMPFEVTTLRTDVETDGRHARVAFTGDWAADAARRDFTINALYCDASGRVYDFTGGLADLDPPRIRFIGDAAQRIREDYLRILRFFRFTAAYTDGALDPAGRDACTAELPGLARISAERIQAEFLKLLAAPHASAVLDVMATRGVLRACLDTPCNVPRLARLAAIETALGLAPNPLLRLTAMTPHVETAAAGLAQRLRLSNADAAVLVHAASGDTVRYTPGDATRARRLLYADGPARFRARVLIAWTISGAPSDSPAWTALYQLPSHWTAPAFPLTGADCVAAGVSPGPQVGVLLREIEIWWLERGFALDRAAVLAELTRRLNT
jgi:poly(A) polymerase